MSIHITPHWQDVSGGRSTIAIATVDHAPHGIEVRRRIAIDRPADSDPGEGFLVRSQASQVPIGVSKRLWMKSAATQLDVVIYDPQAPTPPFGDSDSSIATTGWVQAEIDAAIGAIGAVAIENFGAVGDGTTDDTVAFQAAAASGQIVSLAQGKTYRLTHRVDFADGSGLVGKRNSVIYADPAFFTHASTTVTNRYGTTAVALMAQGASSPSYVPLGRVTFRGFKLVLGAGDATTDGRFISGIGINNVAWIDIQDVEITGGTTGAGMMINDVAGIIANNYIHDFYDDRDWTPEFPQMLGIWLDGDAFVPPPEGGSNNLRITGNVVQRMMVGPAQYAVNHWQPDGIGLASVNSHNVEVDHNDVSYVGKGIWQLGGTNNRIHHNRVSYAFNQAVYGGAGCQNSVFSNNKIFTAGAAGIQLGGGGTRNTTGNVIRDNFVVRVGDTNWSGFGAGRFNSADTACYMSGPDAAATYKETGDKFIDNFGNPDTTGAGVLTWSFYRAGSPPQTIDWLDNVGLAGTAGIVKNTTGELGIYRDGSATIAPLDVANTWTAAQTIATTTAGTGLTIQNTDNTANGPALAFTHLRTTATTNDELGELKFNGKDSTNITTLYSLISAISTSVVNGAESGRMDFGNVIAGTMANRMYLGAGLMVGAAADPGSGGIAFLGKLAPEQTLVAAGTTGAATINKPAGRVNFAAGATSLVVTNSLVTAGSLVIATVQSNDTTMKSAQCVPGSGSFTIYPNANPTAETRVGFLVMN